MNQIEWYEKTGGAAFPTLDNSGSQLVLRESGMTLRDHFAGVALQGMLADLPKTMYGLDWEKNVVEASFRIAALMVKESAK